MIDIDMDDILAEKSDSKYFHIRPEDIPDENICRFGKAEVESAVKNLLGFFKAKGYWSPFTVTELYEYSKEAGFDPNGMLAGLIGYWTDEEDTPLICFRGPAHYLIMGEQGNFYASKLLIGRLIVPENIWERERKVLLKGVPNGDVCPPQMDYCWECGHIAPAEVFYGRDICPNEKCPFPKKWND
ncbi:MAG: hypothetical protein M0Q27_01150 [Candidatus Colwellbacteria bacterium]|jgi:hypothetical protein|nr:hypothetical protein [Candidatus Colwellbacteria bacterium]MCK9497419.1 hypothetical protein [Candidatus Colwellbacteria bacterium]